MAECFCDLEGCRLLALYAVGVHGVHEGEVAELLGDPLRELQGGVEVALDLDYLRPMGQHLDRLTERDLTERHHDEAPYAGPRRVGGG
jgi:hypothetical protein